MTGHHTITNVRRTLSRSGWKIVHFSRFLDKQEVTTSYTTGLPGVLPHIRENIHIRGLEKNLAEAILDSVVALLVEKKKVVDPGDTIRYEHRKFLVIRKNIPKSICTEEQSILILHPLEPNEQRM